MPSRRQFMQTAAVGLAAGVVPARARERDVEIQPTSRRDVIDWHGHWVGPHVVELLASRPSPRPPQGPGWFDIDARLRQMDIAGVGHQVLSWVGASFDGVLTAEDARPLWRAQNDDVAAVVGRLPARFSGLASLPTANVAWAAEELERAHRDLGLIGAVLPLDAFITLEGARTLAPIFDVAQRHKSHLFVHRGLAGPAVPGQRAELGATNPYFGLAAPDGGPLRSGTPGDYTAARTALITAAHLATGVITLALSDLLDAYPDVTVQVAMLGGAIAFVAEQVQMAADEAGHPIPAERWRRVYLDTGQSGRGPRSVALAAKVFGADRILFGSDSGPTEAIGPVIQSVQQAALTDAEKTQIFSGNGRRVLAAKGVSIA